VGTKTNVNKEGREKKKQKKGIRKIREIPRGVKVVLWENKTGRKENLITLPAEAMQGICPRRPWSQESEVACNGGSGPKKVVASRDDRNGKMNAAKDRTVRQCD